MTFEHMVSVSSVIRGEIEEAVRWTRDNCGRYHLDITCIPNYQSEKSVWRACFRFENECDATAFRLRW